MKFNFEKFNNDLEKREKLASNEHTSGAREESPQRKLARKTREWVWERIKWKI